MLVFTKQQNKLTLSLLIQYCQKVSDLIPSEALRLASQGFLSRRAQSAVTARGLSGMRTWLAHLIFFLLIYRSFPVRIRIQCDVSQYMHFRFVVRYCVSSSRPDFYLLSVKEIFNLVPRFSPTHPTSLAP